MFTEMHLHTEPVSPCANVSPQLIPKIYYEKNYRAIVVTNHYNRVVFESFFPKKSRAERVDYYLSGYYTLKEHAEKYNLKVFLGMEIALDCFASGAYYDCEFLLYGLTDGLLIKNPLLFSMPHAEFYKFCGGNNIAVYQAHPFRGGNKLADITLMDGIEGLNGNPRHNSNNDIAKAAAEKFNLKTVKGSDYHEFGDEGTGTGLPDFINTDEELGKYLKSNK